MGESYLTKFTILSNYINIGCNCWVWFNKILSRGFNNLNQLLLYVTETLLKLKFVRHIGVDNIISNIKFNLLYLHSTPEQVILLASSLFLFNTSCETWDSSCLLTGRSSYKHVVVIIPFVRHFLVRPSEEY